MGKRPKLAARLRKATAMRAVVRICLFLAVVCGAVFAAFDVPPAAGAGDTAGTVVRIEGQAVAVQDAMPRPLGVGDAVRIGDVLSTAAESRIEIRMIDDGVFTLGARAVFVVLDYTFAGAGSATTRLIEGAVQAVGGKLAALESQPFRMQTEFATIGIRGTKFFAGRMPDGAFHVGLWSAGAVTVANAAGSVAIERRGFGTHIDSPGAAPGTPRAWPADMNAAAKKMISFSE